MIAQRAREIMDSIGVIAVHYQGRQVWLEEMQEDQVTISFIEHPGRTMQVDIGDLVEQ
ncbi:MAG: small, acid-soluble spore protein, H family [Methylocystaceae bacterium]